MGGVLFWYLGFFLFIYFAILCLLNFLACITAEPQPPDLAAVTLGCNQRLLLVLMCINYQYVLQDLEISFADFLEAASPPPCPVLGHLTACAPRLWDGFHD